MTPAEVQWLLLPVSFTVAWYACGLDLLAKRL
jgi:hypothetical protein